MTLLCSSLNFGSPTLTAVRPFAKMATQPDDSQREQPQRALSPKSQFEQAAQNAHTLAADADLFRQMYQYVTDSAPAQARLERATAEAAGNAQDQYAPGPRTASPHPPMATSTPQPTPDHSHSAQHPPAYGTSLEYMPQQAVMPQQHQISKPAPYWLPPQFAQLQSNHSAQNGNMQNNPYMHGRVLPSPTVYGGHSGTVSQYHLAPPGLLPSNTQLHQPAPIRPSHFNPQRRPSPSVTPNITASASASPSTPNVSSSTPASSAPGDTPSSNLVDKQHKIRQHTRVSEVEDPAICHICFHMVVLKNSIKHHLVTVHGWSKEDAREIDISSKSELLAAGYEIPRNFQPKRITSNAEAAANPEFSKIPLNPKLANTVNAAGPVALPASGPPPKAGSAIQTAPKPNSGGVVPATRRRYGLNLNPPGLVAPGKVLNIANSSETAKGLPALGEVFTGVNGSAAQPPTASHSATIPTVTKRDTIQQHLASVVPAKRTHEAANAAEVQNGQAASLHRLEPETWKPDGGATQTSSRPLLAPSASQSASNGSCVSGNRPNLGIVAPPAPPAPASTSKVMPWLNGVESRQHTTQELQEIAKATLSLMPDDLKHAFGGNAGHMLGFLSQDLAARNAVISAVDYHEGTIAAASVQLELDKMKYQGNSKDAEGTPAKRLKMSYGEIFVPEDYLSDERLANVDRDRSEAANDIEPEVRIERIISTTPEPKETEMPDVQVWDDCETDEEE